MGIQNFNPFVRSLWPHAFEKVNMKIYRGQRIAIDTDNLLYRYLDTALKMTVNSTANIVEELDYNMVFSNLVDLILNFVVNITSHGILPVFVFDGKKPILKANTQKKRRDDRNKILDRIEELSKELSEVDIFDHPDHKGKEKELRDLRGKVIYVRPESMEYLRNILISANIPVLQAVGEGEKLCSMLTIEGYTVAVYSRDTDNLAYGCPTMIHDIRRASRGIFTASIVHGDVILNESGLSYNQFLDLCIMGGCDFNINMPRVQLKRAYPLIREYGSIEGLPSNYDTSVLLYKECREIFAHIPSNEFFIPLEQQPKSLDEILKPRREVQDILGDMLIPVNAERYTMLLPAAFNSLPLHIPMRKPFKLNIVEIVKASNGYISIADDSSSDSDSEEEIPILS